MDRVDVKTETIKRNPASQADARAFDRSTAQAFDSALSKSTEATKALKECRAVLIDELSQDSTTRVYEMYPTSRHQPACKRAIINLVGHAAPEDIGLFGGPVNVSLVEGRASNWEWGFPTTEEKAS